MSVSVPQLPLAADVNRVVYAVQELCVCGGGGGGITSTSTLLLVNLLLFDVLFQINGTKYNISSTKFLQGLCFQVDYSSGGAVQGNAKANASILISTGPDQESLTFNLTLELQYIVR